MLKVRVTLTLPNPRTLFVMHYFCENVGVNNPGHKRLAKGKGKATSGVASKQGQEQGSSETEWEADRREDVQDT